MACGGSKSTRDVSLFYRNFESKRKHVGSNLLECKVCNDTFCLQGTKVPRLLVCGHSFCHECLAKLSQHEETLRCPFDRQVTNLADSGVWGLKKNFALLELLEKLETSSDSGNEQRTLRRKKHNSRPSGIPCDENEDHQATVFCTVCSTHLCDSCAASTHATKTLIRHKHVPLSEKSKEKTVCNQHPPHIVEYACMEKDCAGDRLMCFVCKDYGRHHNHKTLPLSKAAESTRSALAEAVQHTRPLVDKVSEAVSKLKDTIRHIEGSVQVVEDLDGFTETRQAPGTAEMARSKVRLYFQELNETIQRQQQVAFSVLDTHIRERLHFLRQYQEEFCITSSTLTSMSEDCEKMVHEDDAKVLQNANSICVLLDTLHLHQQHFMEASERISLDASIPVTFTKDNRVHIGQKMEMRVVVLGLDQAGKTTILFKLKENEVVNTIPTIGFNVETVEHRNLNFTIWDVGGDPKLRPLWRHYYLNTQALVFVVDSADADRLEESYDELSMLMSEKQLKDAVLLIFANKQDLPNALSIDAVTERLALHRLCYGRSWLIQPCNAKSGEGLWEGLEWLSQQLVAAGVMDLA